MILITMYFLTKTIRQLTTFLALFLVVTFGNSLYVKFNFNHRTFFGSTLGDPEFSRLLKGSLEVRGGQINGIIDRLKQGDINTNSDNNYRKLDQFLHDASTYMSLPEVSQNMPALEKQFAQWNVLGSKETPEAKYIFDYFKDLEAIRELKTGGKKPEDFFAHSAATLIDPSWIITAAHTFQIAEGRMQKELKIDEAYQHPALDLILVHLKEPLFLLKPIKRYRGTYTNQDCYLYSDVLHNETGQVLLSNGEITADIVQGHHFSLMGVCNLSGAPGSEMTAEFKKDAPFTFKTFGGDSGGPVFIKTGSAGVPENDFQLIAINRAPSGDSTRVINLSYPEVNTWIDNIIIGKAIGNAPIPTKQF